MLVFLCVKFLLNFPDYNLPYMLNSNNTKQFIDALKQEYPQAFQRTFIFYGLIKTKGLMDERKEIIPLILALCIFLPLSYVLSEYIAHQLPQFAGFQAGAIAVLGIMLFFMLICPMILKQIKHSSRSLYLQLQHTPFKLTLLILLQGLNLAFIESWFVQGVLFFLAISFGFIRFYKENLFKESTSNEQYLLIQEIRRISFWTYKKNLRLQLTKYLVSKSSPRYEYLQQQQQQFTQLHQQLIDLESRLCKIYKYNLQSYLDQLM